MLVVCFNHRGDSYVSLFTLNERALADKIARKYGSTVGELGTVVRQMPGTLRQAS